MKYFYLDFKRNISQGFKTQIKEFNLKNQEKNLLSDPDKNILSGGIYS